MFIVYTIYCDNDPYRDFFLIRVLLSEDFTEIHVHNFIPEEVCFRK